MAIQAQLDILQQGTETWNTWRKQHRETYVDLRGANLAGAILNEANLTRADLTEANLGGADLTGAILSSTNLAGADFSEAQIGFTLFVNNDLRAVKGLETVRHAMPSSIGVDTISRSEGNIPAIFLREAGVPESIITYMRSLTGTAVQYYTCFISYSSRDQEFAEHLYADLQSKGIRCWFAPEDIKIGEKFRQRIDESIRLYDKMLLVQ